MSTETMRFSSCFLAKKKSPTVLFDLLGLGFPTFTAFLKIRREFTVSVDLSVSNLYYVATGAADNVGRVTANHSWPDVRVCGCVFTHTGVFGYCQEVHRPSILWCFLPGSNNLCCPLDSIGHINCVLL